MSIRDHVKYFAKSIKRNFWDKAFDRRISKHSSWDSNGDKFKVEKKPCSTYLRGEGVERLRVTIPVFDRTVHLTYAFPVTLEALKVVVDDIFFEVMKLSGEDMDDAVNGLYSFQDEVGDLFGTDSWNEISKRVREFQTGVPPNPSEQSLEIKNTSLGIVDIIQREYDLTRFQAHYVFSRVFMQGYPPNTDGDVVEEAVSRVRNYLADDDIQDAIRNMQPPFEYPPSIEAAEKRDTAQGSTVKN